MSFLFVKNQIGITVCSLSVYLHNVLKNHTAHACEGDTLVIKCPSRTSVTVLSAFYGRRVPNQYLCPSVNSNAAVEDTECTSALVTEVCKLKCGFCFRESFSPLNLTSNYFYLLALLQKVMSECQYRQSCQIPVFSPVFGQDPCPLTSKYLLVSYKCRPGKQLRFRLDIGCVDHIFDCYFTFNSLSFIILTTLTLCVMKLEKFKSFVDSWVASPIIKYYRQFENW